MNEYKEKYQDHYELVKDLTASIMLSLRASPTFNFGAALGFPQARSGTEAVALWVEVFWIHYNSTPPTSLSELFRLSEKMALNINLTITEFYGHRGWQHEPKYRTGEGTVNER